MRLLKNHLALILPLVSILFAIQFYIVADRVIKNYETDLSSNYSIVAVSTATLDENETKRVVKALKQIKEISADEVISKLKEEISPDKIGLLKASLPRFYRIGLTHYPDADELLQIQKRLLGIKGVTKVETFAKTHDRVYRLLVIIKGISKVFIGIIFAISSLLIIKQMQVWQFEHRERMNIMALFGAPVWLRSGVLIRLAVADALISALLVSLLFYYIFASGLLEDIARQIGLQAGGFDIITDTPRLLVSSIAIALLSVIFVITRQPKE